MNLTGCAWMLVSLVCLCAGEGYAQSFEVASLKPNRTGDFDTSMQLLYPGGGRSMAKNISLRGLILIAYQVRDAQLSDSPSWLRSETYDLDARYQGDASIEQVRVMLQNLLIDRCKLRIRREQKEGSVYSLVAAKGGPKLREARPDDGFAEGIAYSSRDRGIIAGDVTMAAFAETLSNMVSAPVLDRTGLTGRYSFKLSLGDAAGPDADGPSIFTAVQEQLGLKLEAGKGPVEYLEIDRVEKPSEN
jgi:uncharacterized protein (TIGR03435 family)